LTGFAIRIRGPGIFHGLDIKVKEASLPGHHLCHRFSSIVKYVQRDAPSGNSFLYHSPTQHSPVDQAIERTLDDASDLQCLQRRLSPAFIHNWVHSEIEIKTLSR
jgi:hypothetical protein